jgi:hypothetical protein
MSSRSEKGKATLKMVGWFLPNGYYEMNATDSGNTGLSSNITASMPLVKEANRFLDGSGEESPFDFASCLPIALVVEQVSNPIKQGRVG